MDLMSLDQVRVVVREVRHLGCLLDELPVAYIIAPRMSLTTSSWQLSQPGLFSAGRETGAIGASVLEALDVSRRVNFLRVR
jgi:hypothetical protein